ncbi:MAG: DUF2029 domain-containing protein [bacterium]|nr:DUF2029 domain-containing protein [bacterium]
MKGPKRFVDGGREYTSYNNYILFKQSYYHLIEDQDLYSFYEEEQWDIYKYSPAFSVLFAPFAILPDAIGLCLWNILNAIIFVIAVYYLPEISDKHKATILLISMVELVTSLQSEQSNALIAGLVILAFGLLERNKIVWGTLIIVLTVYIKLFGIIAFSMLLFHPDKWKSVIFSILWSVVLFLLPLIAVSFSQLLFLYGRWGNLLMNDYTSSSGQLSVMGWLYTWFGITINKIYIMLAGAVAFIIPFARLNLYKYYKYRLLILTSMLLWVVIFNHKSESPTYIIAMAGVSIWFVTQPSSIPNILLFIAALLLTSLSPTDIFPVYLREGFFKPYVLKAVPCIFIWVKIIYDIIVMNPRGISKKRLDYGYP